MNTKGRFETLNENIIQWAKDKGILEKATPLAQIAKTLEEVEETREALTAQFQDKQSFTNSKGKDVITEDEVIDGFGDILVTVLIGCKMQNINPLDALESAYNVIAKRTGRMVGGVFVKSEDL